MVLAKIPFQARNGYNDVVIDNHRPPWVDQWFCEGGMGDKGDFCEEDQCEDDEQSSVAGDPTDNWESQGSSPLGSSQDPNCEGSQEQRPSKKSRHESPIDVEEV